LRARQLSAVKAKLQLARAPSPARALPWRGVSPERTERACTGERVAPARYSSAATAGRLAHASHRKRRHHLPRRRSSMQAAAGATAGAAPSPLQSLAQLLLGRRVVCGFHGVQYLGVITETRSWGAHGQLWLVRYDDGDAEELTWPEVLQHLVGGLPMLVG
jgi:hypothetical protein